MFPDKVSSETKNVVSILFCPKQYLLQKVWSFENMQDRQMKMKKMSRDFNEANALQ